MKIRLVVVLIVWQWLDCHELFGYPVQQMDS
jgi:hypothetical protein